MTKAPSTSSAAASAPPPSPPPLLERVGLSTLKKRTALLQAKSTSTDGVVHLLDDAERAAILRIERWAIARAALAGALSAVVAAVAELFVLDVQQSDPVRYWAVVGIASGVAAIIEIAYLGFDALRSVHAMSVAAGVLADDRVDTDSVLTGLARAALEVPNPRTNALGLDPWKETRREYLIVAALLYKLKVSATNIVIKLVVRRALGRAAIRAYIVPFFAIPGTAIWNALVCRIVLREARIRIFGPSLAYAIVDTIIPKGRALSGEFIDASLRAVASCVVRSADLHPNHEHLIIALVKRMGTAMPANADDSRAFIDALVLLNQTAPDDAKLARRMLRAAAVIDGKIARRERALLQEAAAAIREVEDPRVVDDERRRMIAGEALLLP